MSDDLTSAQQREARRRLRRVAGEGTTEEQAAAIFRKAFEQRSRARARREVAQLARDLVNAIFGALGRK